MALATVALYPIAILLEPVVIAVPALYPMAVLLEPVVLNNDPCHIAVLYHPLIILARALLPIAVFDTPVVLRSNAATQSAVVETCVPLPHLPRIKLLIEIFQFWRIRARSILLVRNTRSCAFVVPIKSDAVALFHILLHSVALPGKFAQEATHTASLMRILPAA